MEELIEALEKSNLKWNEEESTHLLSVFSVRPGKIPGAPSCVQWAWCGQTCGERGMVVSTPNGRGPRGGRRPARHAGMGKPDPDRISRIHGPTRPLVGQRSFRILPGDVTVGSGVRNVYGIFSLAYLHRGQWGRAVCVKGKTAFHFREKLFRSHSDILARSEITCHQKNGGWHYHFDDKTLLVGCGHHKTFFYRMELLLK